MMTKTEFAQAINKVITPNDFQNMKSPDGSTFQQLCGNEYSEVKSIEELLALVLRKVSPEVFFQLRIPDGRTMDEIFTEVDNITNESNSN